MLYLGLIFLLFVNVFGEEDFGNDVQIFVDESLLCLPEHGQVQVFLRRRVEVEPSPALLELVLVHGQQDVAQ